MGSIGELAGVIESQRQRLDEVDAGLHAVADAVGGAREALRETWAGSGRHEAATALVALAAALARLGETVQAVTVASSHLGDYVGYITGGAPVVFPAREPEVAPSNEWPPPFYRRFLDGLPVPEHGRAPTDGVLTTVSGVRIEDVSSGREGPGKGGPKLVPRYAAIAVATDHAEGHAAALMRLRKIRHAVVYINNEVCADRPFSCDRVLPFLLPEGWTLTVYGPSGVPRVYTGNGRGVAA
ncbi:DddA-like double-stranded DNA deaminase toxin [Phytomonospora sp. NPDC050363]|uniref:DddA-like double-stranded DNA deaminase toxin n=1 Tax=Phytomonospora sp. NPDC050363 TaxID=3155642 RepID=UPI0033CA02AE